jgi:dTDP-glucose 4,6-dehydratase
MNWTGRKVLVTGAGGFIGSHLTERMVELGADVRALVHYNALGSCGWLDSSATRDQIEVIAADVRDRDSIAAAVSGVDTVFHLAALIAIPYSYRAPQSYVAANIEGTINVLSAARDEEVRRMVHTSTSEVYGSARYVPIDEGHPLQGQSPYAASKIGADMMVQAFNASFAVPVVTVRPFNTFGPRQSTRAVVPTIITQCLTGDTVRLGSLRPTRDLNFVADTVGGFVLAGAADGVEGETINIGSGRETSVGDLVALIAAAVGTNVDIVADDQRLRPERSEVHRLLASNARASTLLGWEPLVPLEEGLRRTVAWYREHLDAYRSRMYGV